MEFSDQPELSVLSLDHVEGPLMLLIFGLSVSLWVFMVEAIISVFFLRVKSTKTAFSNIAPVSSLRVRRNTRKMRTLNSTKDQKILWLIPAKN